MSAQSIAVPQPKDSFPFMLVMSISAHVIAILFALVAPYILPEHTPSEFGGGGGNGGLKVVGVIDFGKGKPGKPATTPKTEEEPAPARYIAKTTKEPDPEELKSKLTLPEEKPKKKDEPTAKSTLNQKERKIEGEYGTGKDTRKESGKSGTDGKGFGISTAGSGGGPGSGAFGTGGTPFPFPWYVENVLSKIELNWVKPYVQETTPQEYNCVVYFVITRVGQVKDIKIEQSSGIPSLDLSAESAIQSSAPFPPLPNQWLEPDLAFRANFSYTR
jgi:TonB family protein